MTFLLTILLSIAGFIALLLVIALFMKKDHYAKRDIIINASAQKVFDYIKLLKNQDEFNNDAMTDANRKRQFIATDGTVGYIYSWSGDKSAGVGEKEIMKIIEGKRIETEIRFTKPMQATATIVMETETISDNQTKV